MSTGQGNFAYAQARLQARLGLRAPADLERARAARDLASYLQQVRASPFARRVARLAPGMDVHEIERRMRQEWGTTVDEVAQWQPSAWRPAVRWMRWLPYLPALQKLARGGRTPAWTREDLALARIVACDVGDRARCLGRSPMQPLQDAMAAQGDLSAAWLAEWRRLWPARGRAVAGLEEVARHVRAATEVARHAPFGAGSDEPLHDLARGLLRTFRRHPMSPTAAIAWLGIEALDQLELRGATTVRAALALETAA